VSDERRPLVAGEVLFDVLPNRERVLGGAPFNVAWHLQAFGLQPLMVTRVGTDESGDEVVASMEAWGMDTTGVQRDSAHPTGTVQVDLDDGEPTFHILPEQAYDYVDGEQAARVTSAGGFSLLYHGSLFSRGEVSRSALDHVKQISALPVFMDVNLRDPWWTRGHVDASILHARWVKLNEAELNSLAGGSDTVDATAFRSANGLASLIVTRGVNGAAVVDDLGVFEAAPPTDVKVVDTVGAGDAFSAVFILGLTMRWPTEVSLARSLEFAAAMCTVPGATVNDRDFYSRFSSRGWW
jgi:fructokinase